MRRRLADSRAQAQRAIEDGKVYVEGIAVPKAATMVSAASVIKFVAAPAAFVSRGGEKLAGALEAFPLSVAGRRAVDAGASTGGFTDCLLQHGAASVAAVDVGYGQLDWKLRTDERVTVFERTNVRHVDPVEIGGPFDVVVADLSFIGLAAVAPALEALGGPAADWILLVKPQFEVGKERVGKGGVVRDPALHRAAVEAVSAALDAVGLTTVDVVESPLLGPAGNREFFLWARRSA